MERDPVGRLRRVLEGAAADPVVAGLSFLDPALLSRAGEARGSAAAVLARVCADLRLDFAFVPSWEPWAADAVGELRRVGTASLWVVHGVLWPALENTGAAAGLCLVARAPDELQPALDAATDAASVAVATGLDLGADGFVVADDLAGAGGPIVGREFLGAAVFPRLASIASIAHGADRPVLMHCDGSSEALYGDIRACGFHGAHGDCGGPQRLERALAAARAEGLGLVGGLSPIELTGLAAGAGAGARIAVLAKRGGLAVADDGGIATREACVALIAALGATGARG